MENIEKLIKTQREYYRSQQTKAYEARLSILSRLKNKIEQYEAKIVRALALDLGKSEFESYATEVGFILEELSSTMKNLKSWMEPKKVATPAVHLPARSFVISEPYGQVLVIAPWNYPFQLAFSPAIGALAAGNTVLVKPSELTPNVAKVIAEIIEQLNQPAHFVAVVGGIETADYLLSQKFDYIFFTGSTRVGKIVMQKAAQFLTPVTLELGGKSPCIVDQDADMETSVRRIWWGKTVNAGQTCVAPDYVFVHASRKQEFIQMSQKVLKEFFPNSIESHDYSKIVNTHHFDRLQALMLGGKAVVGGESDRTKLKIAPTLLDQVDLEHSLMQEEIFGPLMPLLTFEALDECIEFINQRAKPLALYYFGKKESRKQQVLSQVSFGGGCINDTLVHLGNPDLPFGGVGDSGIGNYHGQRSFDLFSHQKSIMDKALWPDIPIRYAPYKDKTKFLRIFFN
jgi:aldehyde dehydrogenase (NAD+)